MVFAEDGGSFGGGEEVDEPSCEQVVFGIADDSGQDITNPLYLMSRKGGNITLKGPGVHREKSADPGRDQSSEC